MAMGCGGSTAQRPLGGLFDTPTSEGAGEGARPRQKLQPDSTPAEWLAFFDLRVPESDGIVQACEELGATRAADVLLVSDEELASMRGSLRLPIPRRKFDRALRALRAAAKRVQTTERPGSAVAFRAQLREEPGADSPGGQQRLSSGIERCPFCDHCRPSAHVLSPDSAYTTPQASPSRATVQFDEQQKFLPFEAGRPSQQVPPWNPWQQAPGTCPAGNLYLTHSSICLSCLAFHFLQSVHMKRSLARLCCTCSAAAYSCFAICRAGGWSTREQYSSSATHRICWPAFYIAVFSAALLVADAAAATGSARSYCGSSVSAVATYGKLDTCTASERHQC